MTFILLDSLSLPGSKLNEDAFAHGDDAALVLDGATPLGEPLMPGPSDAAWLAQFGARRLMAHLKDGDAPGQALTHTLNDAKKSFEALRRRPLREKWETPCASLMLVCCPLRSSLGSAGEMSTGHFASRPHGPATTAPPAGADAHGVGGPASTSLECLWFGDCGALFFKDGACEIVGDAFDRRGRESDWARQIAKEKNFVPAPDLNRPKILAQQRAGRNRINSGGNWLFSPEPRAAAHVSRRSIKVAPGSLLLVASDGFLALATDYGAYDAAGLVTAARQKGLAALSEELRAIENGDAMAEKFARFKKSDDATALLLEIR